MVAEFLPTGTLVENAIDDPIVMVLFALKCGTLDITLETLKFFLFVL